jgi:sigma-E factor negative regulatory protein RseC
VARARVGDYVEVEIEDRVILKGAALVYVFPLVAFLAGYGVGIAAASALGLPAQVPGVIGAFVFLGLSFLGLRAAFGAGILSTHELTPVIRAVVSRPES